MVMATSFLLRLYAELSDLICETRETVACGRSWWHSLTSEQRSPQLPPRLLPELLDFLIVRSEFLGDIHETDAEHPQARDLKFVVGQQRERGL